MVVRSTSYWDNK